jgi:hypothetical protein
MMTVPAMHPMRITSCLDWVVVTLVVIIRDSHCKVKVVHSIIPTHLLSCSEFTGWATSLP